MIGAGAAGLAAVRTARSLGLSVRVLEAKNRVGGRAWTETASLGTPWDRGAHWLLSSINGMSYVAFTTPGTPEAALKDLRASYVKVTKNQNYLADQKKVFGFNLPVIDVATGTHFTNLITKVPDSRKTFLKNYIAKVSKKKKKS